MSVSYPRPAVLSDISTDSCRTQLQIQSHASAPGLELLLLVLSRTRSFIVLCTSRTSYLYELWMHFQRCLYVAVT